MRWAVLICLLLAPLGRAEDDRPDRRVSDPKLQGRINIAIDKGVAYLKSVQEKDGAWMFNPAGGPAWEHYDGGITALALYALAASRVPANDPAIVHGLRWTVRHQTPFGPSGVRGTYCASLLVLALTRIDAKKHSRRIKTLTGRIVEGQLKSDMWSYQLKSRTSRGSARGGRGGKGRKGKAAPGPVAPMMRGDNSNSQFAVLALWAAQTLARAEVPRRTWTRIHELYRRSQLPDGQWGYQGAARSGKPTMTAAGLVSYVYATAALNGGVKALPEARKSSVARKGLKKFLGSARPFNNYYYVYSLERVGTVLAVPERDWYENGARTLLAAQADDGSWSTRGGRGHGDARSVYETSLALLFLSRATAYAITPGGDSKPARRPNVAALNRLFSDYLADPRPTKRDAFGLAGKDAIPFLISKLRNHNVAVRRVAFELLNALVDKSFFFEADWPATDRRQMIIPIESFWRTHQKRLAWDAKRRLFVTR